MTRVRLSNLQHLGCQVTGKTVPWQFPATILVRVRRRSRFGRVRRVLKQPQVGRTRSRIERRDVLSYESVAGDAVGWMQQVVRF